MTDIQEVANRTGAAIGLAYRRGEARPVELVECLLDRIAQSRSEHVFITVSSRRALAEAEASDARYRRGSPLSALDGVPVAWKDLIDIAGTPTTAGSRLFLEQPEKTQDLVCAANATAAGMVTVGKLNLSELAYSGLGLNPHFGTPRNPHDPRTPRAPGGSSSGCGVAVAAGLVTCAVGTDTGGSVRIPAAFNGITGYKTSCGRIDKTGLMSLSRTYDTVGPLARSVEDCILLDAAMRGAIPTRTRPTRVAGLSLLVPTNVIMEDVESAVSANFQRALDTLSASGVVIRHERVEALDQILDMTARFGTLTAAEAYREYRDLVGSDRAVQMDRRVLVRIMDGKRMSPGNVLAIREGRQKSITDFLGQLGDALIAMPTTPLVAPAIAPLEADDAHFHAVNQLVLRNTMLGNVLDLCAVAMPSGTDAEGMPTSILFSAGGAEDERLLSAALAIEQVLDAGSTRQPRDSRRQ
jgi:aspartyl-tRNA(Asn)/glutamyl-tRNA(Gln) amidotransferase subunit A